MKEAKLKYLLLILIIFAPLLLGHKDHELTSKEGSVESKVVPPATTSSLAKDRSEVELTPPRTASEWLRKRILNIQMRTQENKPVRFYDDMVKGKIVLINFMFANCSDGICPPMTGNLVTVQRLLGDRVGQDIFMLSITMDPEHDTPEVLKKYAERFGVGPGWTFLTGKYEEIEQLRRNLGIYDPDPIIDADKTQHAGLVTFGNERTGRWAALPALMKAEQIVEAVLRITDPHRGRHRSRKNPHKPQVSSR